MLAFDFVHALFSNDSDHVSRFRRQLIFSGVRSLGSYHVPASPPPNNAVATLNPALAARRRR